MDALNFSSSSVFALFWNTYKSMLAQKIIGNLSKFLEANDIFWMYRVKSSINTSLGQYLVGTGGNCTYYEFNKMEMAPLAGVFALNYSSCVWFWRLTNLLNTTPGLHILNTNFINLLLHERPTDHFKVLVDTFTSALMAFRLKVLFIPLWSMLIVISMNK